MITVYTPDDLTREAKDKPFEELEYHDFRYSQEPTIQAELVIYFEDQSKFKIIKNRYLDQSKKTKELLGLLGIRLIG